MMAIDFPLGIEWLLTNNTHVSIGPLLSCSFHFNAGNILQVSSWIEIECTSLNTNGIIDEDWFTQYTFLQLFYVQ